VYRKVNLSKAVCGREHFLVAGGGGNLHIRRVAANVSNKQSLTTYKGWYSNLGLGEVLITSYCKTTACYDMLHSVLELAVPCGHGNETSGSIKRRKS